MARMLFVALSALVANVGHAQDVGSIYTGGTCKLTPCNFMADPGAAHCKDGVCKCNKGNIAYGSKCMKPQGCDTRTHGTCRLLPCNAGRGWTDCKDGYCECQADACVVNGKCEKACEYRTGGTCVAFSCNDDRKATCEAPGVDYWGPHGYRCICPAGKCNAAGVCKTGRPMPKSKGAWNSTVTDSMKKEKKASMKLANKEPPSLMSALPEALEFAKSPDSWFQHPHLLILPCAISIVSGLALSMLIIFLHGRFWSRSVVAPESMLG